MSIQWRITVCFLFLWSETVKYVFYGTIRNLKDQGDLCNKPGENSVSLQSSIHSLGWDIYLIVGKTVVFETYWSKTFRTAAQLFGWSTNRARISINPLGVNDRFCTHWVTQKQITKYEWSVAPSLYAWIICWQAQPGRGFTEG